eukprot:gene5657-11414_t
MLFTGIAPPLLLVIFITSAVLSYFIQTADAGEIPVAFVGPTSGKNKGSAKRIQTFMTSTIGQTKPILSNMRIPKDHLSSPAKNHYACPPTSVEALRRRYGTRQGLWGEWTCTDTRRFYRQQLPRALQIDGFLGLSLEERARLASEARHALRVYSRERCHLPGRLMARLLDGVRHLQTFGYWSSTGMTWEEIRLKYENQIRLTLGPDASEDLIEYYMYKKILDRACETNTLVDELSLQNNKSNLSIEIDDNLTSTPETDSNQIISRVKITIQKLDDISKIHQKSSFLSDSNSIVLSYINNAGALVHTVLTSKQFQFLEQHLLLLKR